MNRKTLPIYLSFLCMGFGDAVGPIVGPAKDQFQLTNFMATLIPSVAFIMFGVLSIPMGLLQDRAGKKRTLVLGLGVALAGLILPTAMGLHSYPLFLLTIMLLGAGATILQVAGNPIMRDISPPGTYARNLTLAQFVKAIGSLSGPVIIAIAARRGDDVWAGSLFAIYAVVMLTTMGAVGLLRVEEKAAAHEPASLGSCLALLKNPFVAMMVMAIFLYVGAEVSISSGVPLYLSSQFGVDVSKVGVLGTGLFFVALTVGRFAGSLVLSVVRPGAFLMATCLMSLVSIVGLFAGLAWLSVACFFLIGLGFANIFPLVFSIAVDRMPDRANELSGLMVTAIAGGAVIPSLMGMVADHTSVLVGLAVPAAAIAYVGVVAMTVSAYKPAAATAY